MKDYFVGYAIGTITAIGITVLVLTPPPDPMMKECPRYDGEKVAYTTYYPDGKIVCTYVPNIRGIALRSIQI